jgi:hypothetical protein
MNRQNINRISGVAPVVLSLAALLIVLVAVATGWDKGLPDEGAAAHIFQLLIAVQVPIILIFLATADRKQIMRIVGPVALQAAALIAAIGSVAYFNL